MYNRIIILIITLGISISLMSGCEQFGLKSQEKSGRGYEGEALMALPPSPEPTAMRAGETFEQPQDMPTGISEQKIIRSASLTIEVRDIEKAQEEARLLVEGMGGMISHSSSFEDDAGIKSLRLMLRVPQDKLDSAIAKIKAIGHVRAEDIQGIDVTEEYVDMQIRLANAMKLENRLLTLLETKTSKLKDVLDTEKELARVREKIESMEGRKRLYDNRINMSTIQVTFTEPRGFGRGIFEPLAGCFQRALSALTSSIALLIVFVSAAIPWAALLILLSWLFLRFLRFWIKHKRAMKAKKEKSQ
ncbi:MAG: DUF4349 domain-containing protein [Pseudomonadota bacterium]